MATANQVYNIRPISQGEHLGLPTTHTPIQILKTNNQAQGHYQPISESRRDNDAGMMSGRSSARRRNSIFEQKEVLVESKRPHYEKLHSNRKSIEKVGGGNLPSKKR